MQVFTHTQTHAYKYVSFGVNKYNNTHRRQYGLEFHALCNHHVCVMHEFMIVSLHLTGDP